MKHFTPALLASLALLIASTVEAGPIPGISQLAQREPADDGSFAAFARDFDLSLELEPRNFGSVFDPSSQIESRGFFSWLRPKPKPKPTPAPDSDPQRKANFPTGNPKPETPVGQFRPQTAGKHDDYFGDWKKMIEGVDNPAAGKGKKTGK